MAASCSCLKEGGAQLRERGRVTTGLASHRGSPGRVVVAPSGAARRRYRQYEVDIYSKACLWLQQIMETAPAGRSLHLCSKPSRRHTCIEVACRAATIGGTTQVSLPKHVSLPGSCQYLHLSPNPLMRGPAGKVGWADGGPPFRASHSQRRLLPISCTKFGSPPAALSRAWAAPTACCRCLSGTAWRPVPRCRRVVSPGWEVGRRCSRRRQRRRLHAGVQGVWLLAPGPLPAAAACSSAPNWQQGHIAVKLQRSHHHGATPCNGTGMPARQRHRSGMHASEPTRARVRASATWAAPQRQALHA